MSTRPSTVAEVNKTGHYSQDDLWGSLAVKTATFSPDLRKFAAAYHYGHDQDLTEIRELSVLLF